MWKGFDLRSDLAIFDRLRGNDFTLPCMLIPPHFWPASRMHTWVHDFPSRKERRSITGSFRGVCVSTARAAFVLLYVLRPIHAVLFFASISISYAPCIVFCYCCQFFTRFYFFCFFFSSSACPSCALGITIDIPTLHFSIMHFIIKVTMQIFHGFEWRPLIVQLPFIMSGAISQ